MWNCRGVGEKRCLYQYNLIYLCNKKLWGGDRGCAYLCVGPARESGTTPANPAVPGDGDGARAGSCFTPSLARQGLALPSPEGWGSMSFPAWLWSLARGRCCSRPAFGASIGMVCPAVLGSSAGEELEPTRSGLPGARGRL